jgi:hypothetical protein
MTLAVSGTVFEPAFRCEVTDTGLTGHAQFVTTAHISASTLADVPEDALYRMVCFYLIGQLSGGYLQGACQGLVDSYQWQKRVLSHVPTTLDETRLIPVATLERINSKPFGLIDE